MILAERLALLEHRFLSIGVAELKLIADERPADEFLLIKT